MARFKKKRSRPTPDPVEPKKDQAGEKPADVPETENKEEAPTPEIPAAEPPINFGEKNENSRKLNKLFWLRVGLAVLAGTAATFILEDIEGEERRWASIAFMIIVFLITIVIAKGMNMQLPSSDRKKIVTQGIGSYIFLYLFMWIVSYTLANLEEASNGIPSPLF